MCQPLHRPTGGAASDKESVIKASNKQSSLFHKRSKLDKKRSPQWRRRKPGELLPGGACSAVGLVRGDCPQQRVEGSAYCYYHHKAERGLLEPAGREAWPELPDAYYPVWPLPPEGYVINHLRAVA